MEIIPKKPRRPVWIVFFLSIFQKKVPRISEKHGKNQKKQWFYSRKYPTFSFILTYDNILIAIMKGVWGRISAPQFSQKRRASSTLTTPSRTRQRMTTKMSSSERSVRSAIVRRSAPGLSRRADSMTNLAHDSIGRIGSPRPFRIKHIDEVPAFATKTFFKTADLVLLINAADNRRYPVDPDRDQDMFSVR